MNTSGLNDLDKFFYSRDSVRAFSEKKIDKEIIDRILYTAVSAPSGQNRQPWDFHVLLDPCKIKGLKNIIDMRLKEISSKVSIQDEGLEFFNKYASFFTFFAKAPVNILVFAKAYTSLLDMLSHNDPASKEFAFADTTHIQSASAAVMQLLLAAHSTGLAACWNSSILVAQKEICSFMNIKPPWELVCLVSLGWPGEETKNNTKKPKKRLALNKTVHYYE
jgi:nitroreductase